MSNKGFDSIYFMTTNRCNLNCAYCYESNRVGDSTFKIGKKAIDWLKSQGNTGRWKHVTFFGGEPLLKPVLIRQMIKYALEGDDPIDKFSILSNGTIWNKEVETTLKYMRDRCSQNVLQVSLDGGKISHDRYRKFHDGRGSFNVIMDNIPKFQKIIPNIIFRQTVCPENIPYLYEDFKMMLDMSGPMGNVSLTPIVEAGWTDNVVKEYCNQIGKILDLYDRTDKKTFFNLVHGTRDRLCYQEARDMRGCSAGRSLACVTTDGDIYPCHRFASYKHLVDLKIGDIWNDVDYDSKNYKDIISAFGSNDKCNACKATTCNACMATNIAMGHGLDFNPPEGYCNMALSSNEMLEKATIHFIRKNRVFLREGEILKIGSGGITSMEENKNTEFADTEDLMAQAMVLMFKKLRDLKIDLQDIKKELNIKQNFCTGDSNECASN